MDTIKTNTNLIEKWQLSKKTIKARFNFLFNNEKLSDIHFIVGKDKQHRIPAHKLVLAAASDVFETLFFGSLATESNQIELPDIEPTIFLAFLKFIYTDETKIDHETVMSTLYVAKKYNVTALEDYCVDYLETNLDCDHVVLLLRQAKFFDESRLSNICLNYIDQNPIEALANDEFKDMDLDTVTEILKRDTLEIKESKLFETILKWTEAECVRKQLNVTPENQRLVLGPVFKLIRFPLMTIEEFANGPVQSGLLTDREVKDLMLLNITVNPKPAVEFLNVPRCCEKLIRGEQAVKRFESNNGGWIRSSVCVDSISFMVNRHVFLVGFGLYDCKDTSVEFDVDLELKHSNTSKVCGSIQTSFNWERRKKIIYKVKFIKPIKITSNTYYTASVTITTRRGRGAEFWCGSGGQSKVTINDLNGKPITFQFTSTGRGGRTNVNKGQIPHIIFSV